MSKWIMLTESMTRGDAKLLLLPVDKIGHIQQGLDKDTHVRMVANNNGREVYYFVKETVEQIALKLGA